MHHSGAATVVAMLAGAIVSGDLIICRSLVDSEASILPIVAKQRLLKQHAMQTLRNEVICGGPSDQ
jgi:hypothetical protein